MAAEESAETRAAAIPCGPAKISVKTSGAHGSRGAKKSAGPCLFTIGERKSGPAHGVVVRIFSRYPGRTRFAAHWAFMSYDHFGTAALVIEASDSGGARCRSRFCEVRCGKTSLPPCPPLAEPRALTRITGIAKRMHRPGRAFRIATHYADCMVSGAVELATLPFEAVVLIEDDSGLPRGNKGRCEQNPRDEGGGAAGRTGGDGSLDCCRIRSVQTRSVRPGGPDDLGNRRAQLPHDFTGRLVELSWRATKFLPSAPECSPWIGDQTDRTPNGRLRGSELARSPGLTQELCPYGIGVLPTAGIARRPPKWRRHWPSGAWNPAEGAQDLRQDRERSMRTTSGQRPADAICDAD